VQLAASTHPQLGSRAAHVYDGKQGFDFLGCHLHKRMSGTLWEQKRKRLYFLQRWPSQRSMRRIRPRVKELTPPSAQHRDLRDVIKEIDPVVRGWGQYFQTGNASKQFVQIDRYVVNRLRTLRRKRKGRHLKAGELRTWTRAAFEDLGLCRLRGTIRFPERPFWQNTEGHA
jgi:hypothetical protein